MFQLIALIATLNLVSSNPISFQECDGPYKIKLNSLSIPGNPIVAGNTSPVNLTINGTLGIQVDGEIGLKIGIAKQIDLLGHRTWVDIPCIDGYGSCTKRLATYFDEYRDSLVCALLAEMGKTCSLPLKIGEYSVKNYIVPVNLTQVPQTILNLADGNIRINVQLQSDSQALYCVNVYATIKLDRAKTSMTKPSETNYGKIDQEEESDEEDGNNWWDAFWNGW